SVPKYRKRLVGFGATDVKRNESVLDINTAAECYNFDCTSGALRPACGVKAHPAVPSSAARYWVYRFYSDETGGYVDQYVFQLTNGLLRYYDSSTGKTVYISGFPYPPVNALNYRLDSKDVLLMSAEGKRLIVWNGKRLQEYANSPEISSMAIHYERLFVTSNEQPTKVFFSDDLDPTNWDISSDGGGFIELLDERGELNKVVSFGSYLYIFRDHGISRVTAFGDQREFSVLNLFVTTGRIYPSSIATCGACMMFLASDGLYMFDGYECQRVLANLDGLITPDDDCASAYADGKYYLACKMNFRDGKTVGCESGDHIANGLLSFDPVTGEYSVTRGLDIRFMNKCTYEGEDFLMCRDGSKSGVICADGCRFDEILPKHWQSPATDFATPDRTKVLRELYIKSDCD
ncbi:MAG: hypothetical protein K2L54_03255, partial [Clostridiales bacterium]|nr:hypothetical protein [Clostridiales bacterium]